MVSIDLDRSTYITSYYLLILQCTVNVLKFRTLLFLFSNKMLLIRAGIRKILVRIGNMEDLDQTASSEAV